MGLAFTPDSSKMISASFDGTLRVWDAIHFRAYNASEWQKERVSVVDPASPVPGIGQDDDDDDDDNGGEAAAPSFEPTLVEVDVWVNAVTGERRSNGDATPPQLRLLAEAHFAGTYTFEDSDGDDKEAADLMTSVAVSPCGTKVFTGTVRGAINAWELAPNGSLTPSHEHVRAHGRNVVALAFAPGDASKLVTAGADHKVRTWDVGPEGLRQLDVTDTPKWLGILEASWRPSRGDAPVQSVHNLMSGTGYFVREYRADLTVVNEVEVAAAESGQTFSMNAMTAMGKRPAGGQKLQFSPDGTRAVVAYGDTTIRVWAASPSPPAADVATLARRSAIAIAIIALFSMAMRFSCKSRA